MLPVLRASGCRNTLEIGTNQGRLLEMLTSDGFFCVGLDVRNHFHDPLVGDSSRVSPAFGVWPITGSSVEALPRLDSVALLSVHHQWVNAYGDKVASGIVNKVFQSAEKLFFIEFAALAAKYGYPVGRKFLDNDEKSLVRYAASWLETAGILHATYLGKARELHPKEPYRFIFVVDKGKN